MKAVYTFSGRVFNAQRHFAGFADGVAFSCSCMLAVLQAKKYVGRVELYADAAGAQLLSEMQLPFDVIHADLDDSGYPPQLWATAKLLTYARQTEPFLHLDLDSYLFGPLPARLAGAGLLAQNSEEDYQSYQQGVPHLLERANYLPDFVQAHMHEAGSKVRALCAGAYGGSDLVAIGDCVAAALATINNVDNAGLWQQLAEPGNAALYGAFNLVLEQYYPAVYAHVHGADLRYLCAGDEPPYFTHLLAATKRERLNSDRLKARVARDYPAHYVLALAHAPAWCGGHRRLP
jgi:hypothetical protein